MLAHDVLPTSDFRPFSGLLDQDGHTLAMLARQTIGGDFKALTEMEFSGLAAVSH
jgi:hypothetical protein